VEYIVNVPGIECLLRRLVLIISTPRPVRPFRHHFEEPVCPTPTTC
jgi:hypothetical protein